MKYSLFKYLVLGVVIALVSSSCRDEPVDPDAFDLGTDYMPIGEGKSWTYEVERILYQTSSTDTIVKFQKEELGIPYESGGQTVYPINVYFKDSLDGVWSLDSLWTIYGNDVNVVKTVNGTSYQNLLFPLELDAFWDINTYNIQDEDLVTLESAPASFAVNDTISYNDAIIVSHDLVDNLINYEERTFTYAYNVGLVYRKVKITEQQPGDDPEGYSITYKLLEYEE